MRFIQVGFGLARFHKKIPVHFSTEKLCILKLMSVYAIICIKKDKFDIKDIILGYY